VVALLIYYAGYCVQNATLTSELLRKTRLAADELAAREIQQTLQPVTVAQPAGFRVETFYKPFRAVSGDYFDVIPAAGGRLLFAIADVSGKGTPAALLAANIQALVRSLFDVVADPSALAARLNSHLCRYTPDNRFATAVLAVVDASSSTLTYVNAGHNPPVIVSAGSATLLSATGLALAWFAEAVYGSVTVAFPAGGKLLLYSDGLTDSIADSNPEQRLRDTLLGSTDVSIDAVTSLIDPAYNEDDITVLLISRVDVQETVTVGV
jgi:sigma-B regulation protein RsbU (phosphoserine phosphatase)